MTACEEKSNQRKIKEFSKENQRKIKEKSKKSQRPRGVDKPLDDEI